MPITKFPMYQKLKDFILIRQYFPCNMIKNREGTIWSSTRQHLRQEQSAIIKTDFHGCCLDAGLDHKNWKEYLLNEDCEMITEMRNKTQKGLAIGDKNFITSMEKRFGIVLSELKAGRPKKQVK